MEVNNSADSKESQAINIGESLSEARTNLALSSEDIANELNLVTSIISKIENNEFNQEIPLAFIRGYIKSYASRVGLDTPSILQEFDRQSGIEPPSLQRVKSISKFDIKRREINSGSYLVKAISVLLVLLFVFFAGLAIWKKLDLGNVFDSNAANESSDVDIPLTIESDDNSISTELTTNIISGAESDKKSSGESADVTLSNAIKAQPAEAAQSNNSVREIVVADKVTIPSELSSENSVLDEPLEDVNLVSLELIFSADCWVKITDARGEVLALGVKTLGKNMTLQGVKPIKVILGEPSVVSMNFDGQNYDLSSYSAGRRAVIELN